MAVVSVFRICANQQFGAWADMTFVHETIDPWPEPHRSKPENRIERPTPYARAMNSTRLLR